MKSITFFFILLTVAGLTSCRDEFSAPIDMVQSKPTVEVSYEDEPDAQATDDYATDEPTEAGARISTPSKMTYFYMYEETRNIKRKGWYFADIKPTSLADTATLATKALKKGRVFDWSKKDTRCKSASLKLGWWMIVQNDEDGLPQPAVFEVIAKGKQIVKFVGDGVITNNLGTGSLKFNYVNLGSRGLEGSFFANGVNQICTFLDGTHNTDNETGVSWDLVLDKVENQRGEVYKIPVTTTGSTTSHGFYGTTSGSIADLSNIKIIEGKTTTVKITIPSAN